MKIKYCLLSALCGISSLTYSLNVDVYGTSKEKADAILNDFGQRLYELEQKKMVLNISHRDTSSLQQPSQRIVAEIKRKYHLPSVSVDSVFYPDTRQVFTTVNICDPSLTKGLVKGVPEHDYHVPRQPDLVDRMYLFIQKAVAFLILHPEYTHKLNCLDYHCITPEHPEFEKDLAYFRGNVPKQQAFIQQTIEHDPQLARRRAAIFLLAYLRNPEDIAKILSIALDDENSYIRHDALRVYGELYAKYNQLDIPIKKIVSSIYSCDEAERNKALLFLNEIAKNPKYQMVLIEEAGSQLITLLHLKQPNNHLFAYQILKKISHKQYSDEDYAKWRQWLQHVLSKSQKI